MKKRISKKVREDAAMICAIAASSPRGNMCVGTWLACETLRLHPNCKAEKLASAAFSVANQAWKKADYRVYRARPIVQFAEAEAMLRTGWCP